MKKDIEWLKDEVNRIANEYADENIFANYTRYMISDIKDAINQLDEAEVLSQEEVDQAYKDGYEKGKQHTFYKGYLEGLADKEKEPETVADVIADFYKSLERLKEVMGMEVEELEE